MLVDKVKALAAAIGADIKSLTSALTTKVDKVAGKGLSTNDYSNEDKTKVDALGTVGSLPQWTSETRPTSGEIRFGFNTTWGGLEYWNGVAWLRLGASHVYSTTFGTGMFGNRF